MYKSFKFPWGTFSVQTTECFNLKDAVTGRMLEQAEEVKEKVLGPLGNRINRKLAVYTYRHPEYEDCEASETEDGSGLVLVGYTIFKVYVLAYQKDNRQTRRGGATYEYKVLNITGRYK